MELFRHAISASVLQHCRELGMLPHLLAGYPGSDESIALLEKIDRRTNSGIPVDEAFAIAALYLRLFMDVCPPSKSTHISEALHKVNDIIIPHCQYFSIASGTRHQARELLIGCFRLARGRGIRGEQRFLQHPLTPKSLELFSLWSQVRPGLITLLEDWSKAMSLLKTGHSQKTASKKRRRTNHRKKNSRTKAQID